MSSSRSRGGPLLAFCKEAGIIADTLRTGVQAAGALGHGAWNAAGALGAEHPWQKAGLLGAGVIGAGTAGPAAASTLATGARYVRGEVPTPRG